MLEYSLRFLAGGIAVSGFAALGDTLRPESFAGLFGAAPSIALPTLLITLSQKGAPFVALEGRSMIVGAFNGYGRFCVGRFMQTLESREDVFPEQPRAGPFFANLGG
jgi:hypothetical protein